MTSPSSSSAASPFSGTGSGQTAPQASAASSLPTKSAPSIQQSFLEAIPVSYPAIKPLEWSFPLIHRGKPEASDVGSLKVDNNLSGSSDAQAAASATPFQSAPAGLPPYLTAETPGSLPAVPSPGNTSSLPSTGQASNNLQKPWRIRYAVYRVKPDASKSTSDRSANTEQDRRGSAGSLKASPLSTPRPVLLQVPHAYTHSPLNPISPTGSLFEKGKTKARSRAASDASQRSTASRSFNGSRRKKRQKHVHTGSSAEEESPEALLRAYYGEERQAEYQSVLDSLTDSRRGSSLKPLLKAKRQFLRSTASSSIPDQVHSGENDLSKSSTHNSITQHGLLPERLAIVERVKSPAQPEGVDQSHMSDMRLYTFSLTSPSLDLSEYTDPDEGTGFPDLEPESSGTFTASDLFPTLYNDNGIYTPPSAMHPASIHPIPSAAALATGQNGSYGKVPFFLSSLNISSSSNKEAVAASEAFLKAVEDHVLDAIRSSYTPDAESATSGQHTNGDAHVSRTRSSMKALRCGHGILYSSHEPLYSSEMANSFAEEDSHIHSGTSVFLECRAHFTAADVQVSAQMQRSALKAVPLVGDAPKDTRTPALPAAAVNGSQLNKGDTLLLCPMSLPAVFLRYYGKSSNEVSRKQALCELESINTIKADLQDLLNGEDASDLALEGPWLLCVVGDGLEMAWPAPLVLRLPGRPQAGKQKASYIHKAATTRIRSSVAKVSPRVPRKLHFRPRSANNTDLVATSLNYIEQQNSIRAKERREKAERSMAGAGMPDMAIDSFSTDHGRTASTKEVSQGSVGSATARDKQEPSKAADAEDPLQMFNALGCPTFESLTLALDKLAGPEPGTPPGSAQQPTIHINEVSDSTEVLSKKNKDDVTAVYPTPQSVPNYSNQMSLDVPESAETGSHTLGQTANASFVDIFQDFSWPGYTDSSGLSVSRQTTSRPTSAGGGGYAPRGVFDDPSTFDLFDTAGLTEEDFSFFDSPIPANALDGNILPSNTFAQDSQLAGLQALTADDLASIVQSGPVDHFGHLMPRGTGNESTHESNEMPQDPSNIAFQGYDVSSSLHGTADSRDEIERHTQTSSHNSHSLESASFRGVEDSLDSQQQPTSEVPRLKYDLSILARRSGLESRKGAENGMASLEISPTTFTSFHPLRFSMPSPPLSDDNCELDSGVANNWTKKDYLHQEKEARAMRLRSALIKLQHPSAVLGHEQCLSRQWQEDPHLLAELSTSSSATSSDDEQPSTDSETYLQPERNKVLSSVKLSNTANAISIDPIYWEQTTRPSYQSGTAPQRPREGLSKVTRGEKDAIATIFFQHCVENIDFRERLKNQYSDSLDAGSLSSVYDVFPMAKPSKKVINAHATEVGVYRQQAVTKLSVAALASWMKLGLKPHNGSKDIQAVVIAPKLLIDGHIEAALQDWLHNVAVVWESLGFGKHASGSIEDCLFTLNCGSPHLSQSPTWLAELTAISGAVSSRIAGDHSCVIYVLVDDSECQTPQTSLMYLCLRLHLIRKGAIPHIVPLSALSIGYQSIPSYEAGGPHQNSLARFAFNVYDRIPACVTRDCKDKKGPNSVLALLPDISAFAGQTMRAVAAPAFHLAPRIAPHIALQLHWPPPALEVLEAHRLFHIAYQLSQDRRWLYLAASDDRAEYYCVRVRLVDTLDLKTVLRRVWSFLKEATDSAAVQWRICICRKGTMPIPELQAWCEILQSSVPQLAHPATVTVFSVTSDTSATCESHGSTAPLPEAPGQFSGISLPTAPNVHHAEGTVRACIAHSAYPTALYAQPDNASDRSTTSRDRLYYSLASASIYYPIGSVGSQPPAKGLLPSSPSYSIHLLATATHPLSTYNRQLASHMVDVAQSYVDLCVLARERWALDSSNSGSGLSGSTCLPWHLQVVSYMPTYDFETLLPS